MRKHRGLSAVVGTVFLVVIVISAMSYVSYSLNIMGNFSESLITEESRQQNKQNEKMEILSVDVLTSNKLDAIIKNSGEIPLKVTTLWIDEQDVNDDVQKFTVDKELSPGKTFNLYPIVNFTMDPTKGYNMKLVTSRGDVQSFYVNSPASQNLFMGIHVLPEFVPSDFTTTVLYTVINNSSNNNILYNVTPNMTATEVGGSTVTLRSGPIPPSYPSIAPGEMAMFEYIYKISGEVDEGALFNATISNALSENFVFASATLKEITVATQAGTAIESFGLSSELSAEDNILFFHEETNYTPNGGFQMDGSAPAGGGGTYNPRTSTMTFWSSNVTAITTVVNGTWNARLAYYSDLVPVGITSPSFAFMFECNDCGGNGDTSESTGNISNDDFEEQGNPIWNENGGPHDDGHYTYDGIGDYHRAEWDAEDDFTEYSDLANNEVSTAVWFRISPTSDDYMPIVRWGDENDNGDDEYEIALGDGTGGNHGKMVYRYTTEVDDNETICVSSGSTIYDDSQWHFVVGTADINDHTCTLYVNGVEVADENDSNNGNDFVDVDDKDDIFIGHNGESDYLTGDVAMLMHWNNEQLNATSVSDLFNTNYGTNGTRVHVTLQGTLGIGTPTQTFYDANFDMPFHDPANNSDNNNRYDLQTNDNTFEKYSFSNFTTTTGINSTLILGDRLKFEFSWDSDTQNLPINIRIDDDDNDFSLPDDSSYLQTPNAYPPWPTYLTFARDDPILYYVFNNGPEGGWLTYQGTRFVAKDISSDNSYAGLVNKVNTTAVNENQDSLYIPDQQVGEIEFWPLTDPPENNPTSYIPAGTYTAAVFISGYNDKGEVFLRTINLGIVTVTG